jgi:hypothetical protein
MKPPAEALSEFQEAILIGEDLAARNPPVQFSRPSLQRALLKAGRIESANRNRAAACEAFRRSVAVHEEMAKVEGLRKSDRETQAEAIQAASACR